MFTIQYRRVYNGSRSHFFGEWNEWPKMGEFRSLYLASQAVLDNVYNHAYTNNFTSSKFKISIDEEGHIVGELNEPTIPRYWQFRFLETVSPWKIGLNDESV